MSAVTNYGTSLRNHDHTIHWNLTWPEGGGAKVENKLRQWLASEIHA